MLKIDSAKKLITGKNKYLFIIVLILVVIGFVFWVVNWTYRYRDPSYVATMNGDPVSVEEYKLAIENDRFAVIGQFHDKYKADSKDKNFWENSYDGKKPADMLRQMALDDSVKMKLEQEWARDLGLVDDITYNTLSKKYLKEKDLRAEISAEKKKEGVNIPTGFQFDMPYFYSEYWGNIEYMMKTKLNQIDYFIITTDKLKSYYNTIKDQYFKSQDTIKVQMVAIPYIQNDQDSKDEASKKWTKPWP